jgi:hypothetical protein
MAEAGDPRPQKRDSASDSVERPPSAGESELEHALESVPLGTFAVSAMAVALLLIGYLYVYLFVFLPRGTVS